MALIVVVAASAAILTRPPRSYSVSADFVNAGQIVRGDLVAIGAAPVGKVSSIRLTDRGLARLDLVIDASRAPLPEGSIARIRLNSLSGVANRYVSLELPGRPAGTIPSGGRIPTARTQTPVDLDAFVSTFDADTRAGLGDLITGGRQQYGSRTGAARSSLQRFGPALDGAADFFGEIARDRAGYVALLRQGDRAMSALAAHGDELADAVTGAQRTVHALASRRLALGQVFARLPATLSEGTRTFTTLRATLPSLDRLRRALAPVAPELPGFFDRLDGTLILTAPVAARLGRALSANGPDNDLTDFLRLAPRLDRRARTAVPRAIRTLDASRAQVAALREYTPDLVASIGHLGQVTANYDANGHYARVQPDLLAFAFDSSNTLQSQPPGDPLRDLSRVKARCPGGAIQASPDGSAPWPVPGCSPSASPGGR